MKEPMPHGLDEPGAGWLGLHCVRSRSEVFRRARPGLCPQESVSCMPPYSAIRRAAVLTRARSRSCNATVLLIGLPGLDGS